MAEPIIRFRNNHSDWDRFVIDDVFELRNGYTPSKNVNQYWENGVIPWFRMEDIRANGGILSDSIQHITPQAVKGGGLFVPYSIILATTATIGVHAMVIADSLANQQFTNFSIRKSLIDKYDSYFIYYAFYKIDEWSLKNTNSGGLLSVDIKGLLKQPFLTPSKTEQQQIASYFKSLDVLIQSATTKIASLKQLKSASLISMFPQEGEVKPRVRFKGFKEDWKNVSFIDITYRTGIKNGENLPLESYSISNEFGFIPQNEQFENGGTMFSADKRMYYIVSPKSFAYNPARINVGSLGYYNGKKEVIVSSLYEVFKTNDLIEDQFLLCWFKTDIFQKMIEQYQEGGVRLYFFYDKLCKCTIKIPSLQEQRQIASFFCSLDKQISLETQRLDKFKQIKSACLDKMFV